jgi:hypothetical protein
MIEEITGNKLTVKTFFVRVAFFLFLLNPKFLCLASPPLEDIRSDTAAASLLWYDKPKNQCGREAGP